MTKNTKLYQEIYTVMPKMLTKNKVQYIKKTGELYLLETLQELWQEISIDIIGLLSKSNDKNAIVVIVDQFTKMIRLKATMIAVSLEEIAKIYKDNI